MRWCTYMISCAARAHDRALTLASLAASDWRQEPIVILDDGQGQSPLARMIRTWARALAQAANCRADLVLLIEDDLRFSSHLLASLENWLPLVRHGRYFFASLYDNSWPLFHLQEGPNYAVASAEFFWGSQALVMTPETASVIVRSLDRLKTPYIDERMGKLAAQVTAIFHHRPGLVQHVGVSTWNPIRRLIPYPVGSLAS